MIHIFGGLKRALGLHRPGRDLDVFPGDVFIVSYPKSGNTWTRFLIANLVHPGEPANFGNINRLIPDPEALSKRALNRLPRPRIIKSHQYFHPHYERIIYVVRDPRDVALSQYHFHRKRMLLDDSAPIEQFISGFVAGKTSAYGSWGENVSSWLATRRTHPGFLLIRYEDMIADAANELAKVASFLGIEASPARLAQAVERSSADQMRRLEQSQAHLWSSTKETRQDIPFVRAAKAGGWQSELSEEAVRTVEAAWGAVMQSVGYSLTSGQIHSKDEAALAEVLWKGPSR